jgi:hypothetical protein
MSIAITEELARKVLAVVDQGLIKGLGRPAPGDMCVEAAVAYASGELHNDHPACVHPGLADAKIWLNDHSWEFDPMWRAKGLRRVAIAQLGTYPDFYDVQFKEIAGDILQSILPPNWTDDDQRQHNPPRSIHGPDLTRRDHQKALAQAIIVRVWADSVVPPRPRLSLHLALLAEVWVRALIQMGTPGSKFLYLTEIPEEIRQFFPS